MTTLIKKNQLQHTGKITLDYLILIFDISKSPALLYNINKITQ